MTLSLINPPISRVSLADSVYETLLQAIVVGRLPSGAELKTVALAQQLEVSRTPVQEALNRLAADGLVVCPTGRRARVAAFTREDVIEIYALRRLLEGEAAAQATRLIAPPLLIEMRQRIESILRTADDVDWASTALESDVWFHKRLAEAAANRRLQQDIQRYRVLVRSFCRMVGTVENLLEAAREHLTIVEAMEQHDAEAARRAMQAHIEARLASVLRDVFPASSPHP